MAARFSVVPASKHQMAHQRQERQAGFVDRATAISIMAALMAAASGLQFAESSNGNGCKLRYERDFAV